MLKNHLQKSSFILLLSLIANLSSAQVFVKQDATGANDGSSWENAYTDLSNALAEMPAEIWVAAGTYLPSGSPADTTSSFSIQNSLSLYGGFSGTETNLNERDPAANPTILSGDLNEDDTPSEFMLNREDNVRHVVYVDSLLNAVIIDGFTVSGGQTNDNPDSPFFWRAGGGIYGLSPTNISNCIFSENFGRSGGAVLLRDGAHGSVIENSTFIDNMATAQGAGLHTIALQDVIVRDCIFNDNFTARGAYYPLNCTNLLIENCEFKSNSNDGGFGGALFSWNNFNLTIRDCDFENNSAGNAGAIYFDEREILTHDAENIKLQDCNFITNTTTGFGGGGIYIFEGSLTVEGCFFDGNTSGNGSHIFQNSVEGNLIYRDCEFRNAQSSGWGGAATAYGAEANYLFEDCIFEENVTTNLGGAVNVGFAAVATFDECSFLSNSSTSSAGGALAAQNDSSTIIVLNSIFFSNKSLNPGGAIFAGSTESSSIIMVDNCEFSANESSDGFGGAINIVENGDDNISKLSLSNSTFVFNSAMDQGGTINVVDADAEITSCLFASNFCFGEGRGTISLNASDSNSVSVSLLNNTIADNTGDFSTGISQWTGTLDAELNTEIKNCLLQGLGANNYAIEAGNPQLISMGGNMSSDESMETYLTQTQDMNDVENEFIDPDDFDYTLTSDSPGIDAGIADGAPEFDLLGNPRVNSPDVGAIENQNLVKVDETLIENNGMFQIYPNPIQQSYANITLENEWRGNIEIRVTNVQGELVQFTEINKYDSVFEYRLSLENINTGIYQITLSNGEAVVVENLIRL